MIQRLADINTDAIAAFEKESKKLLVRWEDDLLTIALAEKESGTWQAAEILKYDVAAASSEDFIPELKQKSTLANYTGLQTEVFVATPQAMLIPTELATSATLFLQTQFGKQEEAQIFTSELNTKMVAGFFVEKEKLAIIQQLFPQALIKSSLGLQVQQALTQAQTDGSTLQVCLGKNGVEMVLVDNGSLLVARSFLFAANEDVLYHLLNACRVHNILPQTVQVVLQGQVQEQDAIYQLLQTYLPHIRFVEVPPVIQHPAFLQVPLHYFTPLIQPV